VGNRVGINVGIGMKAWFQPKEDITTYELALVTELLFRATMTGPLDALPEGVKRHFEVVCDNQEGQP